MDLSIGTGIPSITGLSSPYNTGTGYNTRSIQGINEEQKGAKQSRGYLLRTL